MQLFHLQQCILIVFKLISFIQMSEVYEDGNSFFGQINNPNSCDKDKLLCEQKQIENIAIKNNITANDILVITVASHENDGLIRYLRSAYQFNIKPIVLGFGEPWLGGNVNKYAGGGYKINLLKDYLEQYKDDTTKYVLFTDSYDVVFLANLNKIIDEFIKLNGGGVLFSAEAFCWPDESLTSQYPLLIDNGKRYLNSGMFMGNAADIYKIVTYESIENNDDDQLYYTRIYLNKQLRDQFKIKLDHKSVIFQNLNGAVGEVQLNFNNKPIKLENREYETEPLIVHGNGFSKNILNSLSNYLANSYDIDVGCIACRENTIDLDKVTEYPTVLIAIFIEEPTPFLDEYFELITKFDYPKDKIHIFMHNTVKYHNNLVKNIVNDFEIKYLSVKLLLPEDEISEWTARNIALDHCLSINCDYYFNIDSVSHLDNKYTLKLLIEQNRTFVAPLLKRDGKAWSNFWGALSTDGYYARSFDYMSIVNHERRGLWSVPFINNCYLINSTILKQYNRDELSYVQENLDADMTFCSNLRKLNIFMYISNRVDFGHLINTETFDVTRTSPELYQIFDNRIDWEKRYIHENYSDNFNPNRTPKQPCPDVYWFPVTTLQFCKELINLMENFGQWSDGKNQDTRLDSGYEAVPTRDIHMNQVGWERHYMLFLKDYVRPLQELVFIGYFHDPPRSLMNFVVRYRPDEQPSLRPHHDSSTYTINLALNTPGVDYEGGGCRFIRYNCSVINTKPGWLLMHPGRLTHFHEGLLVTKGTRYILISFVDP